VNISNKSSVNLGLDILLLIALLTVYEQHGTGIAIHEWLGISIGFAAIVHILLHWKWITCITRKFFAKMASGQRLKFVLNLLIFISFSTIIFAGLMMSRSALPSLGIKIAETHFWRWLHFTSVDITIWLVAFHIALNWKWILNAIKHHIVSPLKQYFNNGSAAPTIRFNGNSRRKWTEFKAIYRYLAALMIVGVITALISLSWYELSSSTFAATLQPEHGREHFRGGNQVEPFRERRSGHERENNKGDEIDARFGPGEHHGEDQFSLLRLSGGILKNLIIISMVTAITVYAGRKIKESKMATGNTENDGLKEEN
jgi:hypothetical protein